MRAPLRLWIALITSAACAETAAPTPEPSPEPEPEPQSFPFTLRVNGGEGSDTAGAALSQPLEVELRDTTGALMKDEVVRFESLRRTSGAYVQYATVEVASVSGGTFRSFATDTTDQLGRAAALTRLGILAGPGGVVVTVSRLGVSDTAAFTILPGDPRWLIVEPEDSAVAVGGSFLLRPLVLDQFLNPRQDPVTFTSLDAAASISQTGVVGGQEMGRARLVAEAVGLADSSWVSVVPPGEFAATGFGEVVVQGFDGAGRRRFPLGTSNGGYYPTWTSPGELIVTSDNRLTALSYPAGTVRQGLVPADSGLVEEVWPAAARDGSGIYFAGSKDYASMQLWRVSASGGALERVSPDPNGDVYTWPSPSPDGSRLALVTTGSMGSLRLAVLQVATGGITAIGGPALSPRWAPNTDRIAYLREDTQELWVVDADGSNARRVSPPGPAYAVGMDWAPDEQWLLAGVYGSRIELVNVSTGVVLPLPGTSDLSQPAWRPN